MGESKYVKKSWQAALMNARIAVMCTRFSAFVCESRLLKLFRTCPTIHQIYHFATPHNTVELI